jgi:hypothetical protein
MAVESRRHNLSSVILYTEMCPYCHERAVIELSIRRSTMTKLSSCDWCGATVSVPIDFLSCVNKAVCSVGCWDAEKLFCELYSDQAINDRERLRRLDEDKDI